MDYEDGLLEQLQQKQEVLQRKRRDLRSKLDQLRAYRFEFQYQDPHPNFDRSSVKGRVCTLFDVKDQRDSLALSMMAGGTVRQCPPPRSSHPFLNLILSKQLYSVVTDTDVTSKDILKRGQLQQHTTLLPINKIRGRELNASVVRAAQNLVGKENVAPALSLINYDPQYDVVMKYVFGRTLVCKDLDIAKKVTSLSGMCRFDFLTFFNFPFRSHTIPA